MTYAESHTPAQQREYRTATASRFCDCGTAAVDYSNGWRCARCKQIEESVCKAGPNDFSGRTWSEKCIGRRYWRAMEPYAMSNFQH